MPIMSLLAFAYILLFFPIRSAFAYSSAFKSPCIDRRAIAGLWRLSPRISPIFPLKEFTVRPKQKQVQPPPDSDSVIDEDVLLMLKEDGSFHLHEQENDDNDDENDNGDLDASWKDFQTPKKQYLRDLVKGIWDYRDGMLILAADRPDNPYSGEAAATVNQERIKKGAVQDTLLEGKVVATFEESLQDNPVVTRLLPNATSNATSSNATTATATATTRLDLVTSKSATQSAVTWKASTTDTGRYSLDTYLSVPTGSLKVGKFFYPKTHPSFFDQPMFQPVRRGSFSLRQVLGLLNTQNSAAQEIEKFQRADFYNKTFSLTSHPIVQIRPKGNVRWSIKYNKYVHDPLSKAAQKRENEETELPTQIRVMQVQFHTNYTFSSVAGLGESILRGKFDIIGQNKDQLWMQVTRFGFGRSISGSTYSEGRMLTQEDAKTYWGTIQFEEEKDGEQENNELPEASIGVDSASTTMAEASNDKPERLEVNGSVIMGWGLEPLPVALFIMREVTELDAVDYDDDDYDEDEDDDDDEESRRDDIDWSSAFQ